MSPSASHVKNKMATLRHRDTILFVYDLTAVKEEHDDLKDAIVFFSPEEVDINDQCALCGQLVGMVTFMKDFVRSTASVYTLQHKKVAVRHVGKYILGLGGSKSVPDGNLKRQLDSLYSLYTFYHGHLMTAEEDLRDTIEQLSNLPVIMQELLGYVTHRGDAFAASFDALPVVQLPKLGCSVFLQASHLLQAAQRRSGVLAGCILFKHKVLCTQLNTDITSKLLLLKKNSEFPVRKVNLGFTCPSGADVLSIFITDKEFKMICPNHASETQKDINTSDFLGRDEYSKLQDSRKNSTQKDSKQILETFTNCGILKTSSNNDKLEHSKGASIVTNSEKKERIGKSSLKSNRLSRTSLYSLGDNSEQGSVTDLSKIAENLSESSYEESHPPRKPRSLTLESYYEVFEGSTESTGQRKFSITQLQAVPETFQNGGRIEEQEEIEEDLQIEQSRPTKEKKKVGENSLSENSVPTKAHSTERRDSEEKGLAKNEEEQNENRVQSHSQTDIGGFPKYNDVKYEGISNGVICEELENSNIETQKNGLTVEQKEDLKSKMRLKLQKSSEVKSDPCTPNRTVSPSLKSPVEIKTIELFKAFKEKVSSFGPKSLKFSKSENSSGSEDEHSTGVPKQIDTGNYHRHSLGDIPHNQIEKFKQQSTPIDYFFSESSGGNQSSKFVEKTPPAGNQSSPCTEEKLEGGSQSCQSANNAKSLTESIETKESFKSNGEDVNGQHCKLPVNGLDDSIEKEDIEIDNQQEEIRINKDGASTFKQEKFEVENTNEEHCIRTKTKENKEDEENCPVQKNTEDTHEKIQRKNENSDSEMSNLVEDYYCEPTATEAMVTVGKEEESNLDTHVNSDLEMDENFLSMSLEQDVTGRLVRGHPNRESGKSVHFDEKEDIVYAKRKTSTANRDLIPLELYMQSNSDMVLMLLLEDRVAQDVATMQTLWSSTLPQLGELDYKIKACLDSMHKKTESTYDFLRYDSFQKSLSGKIYVVADKMARTHENDFCEIAMVMHDDFKGNEFNELTLRSHKTSGYGHITVNHETYYHPRATPKVRHGAPTVKDFSMQLELEAETKLLKDHGIVLL